MGPFSVACEYVITEPLAAYWTHSRTADWTMTFPLFVHRACAISTFPFTLPHRPPNNCILTSAALFPVCPGTPGCCSGYTPGWLGAPGWLGGAPGWLGA